LEGSPVFRLEVRAEEEPGGEGVAMGTEDWAVVREEVEGILRCRAGVEKPEAREPSETSGCVPEDVFDGSATDISTTSTYNQHITIEKHKSSSLVTCCSF